MKKTLTIFGFLLATSALFSQSISANFQTDMEGWTGRFVGQLKIKEQIFDGSEGRERLVVETNFTTPRPSAEWANLFAPMNDRGGIRFAGGNLRQDLFMFIQREITDLLPNTNYRITFNTSWLAWLEASASPIIVRVGASIHEPSIIVATTMEPDENSITEEVNLTTGERQYSLSFPIERRVNPETGETEIFQIPPGTRNNLFHVYAISPTSHDQSVDPRARIENDFVVAGQLTPNENGLAFTQNINNFDNAFYVNTDDEGRLFLMIGIETENPNIENVFLNTLRIVLREMPEIQEVQEDEKIEEDEEKTEYEYETINH